MKKIIILDTTDSSVHVYNYDENIYEDGEHFLKENEQEFPHTLDCMWMVTDDLNIQIH